MSSHLGRRRNFRSARDAAHGFLAARILGDGERRRGVVFREDLGPLSRHVRIGEAFLGNGDLPDKAAEANDDG